MRKSKAVIRATRKADRMFHVLKGVAEHFPENNAPIHITADGKAVRVTEMTNWHIRNCIQFFRKAPWRQNLYLAEFRRRGLRFKGFVWWAKLDFMVRLWGRI